MKDFALGGGATPHNGFACAGRATSIGVTDLAPFKVDEDDVLSKFKVLEEEAEEDIANFKLGCREVLRVRLQSFLLRG